MIGILGGMGPHAGALLVERVTTLNHAARSDQDHPRVLLYSNSQIPNRVDAILGQGPSPVPEIVESLAVLCGAGAAFAAIACNTAHVFLDAIRASAPLPVIDMTATVVERLTAIGSQRVALLATEGTVASGLYQSRLAAAGIDVVVPDNATQAIVSAAIYDRHRGIKARSSPIDGGTLAELRTVSERLLGQAQAQTLLIACTELSIAYRHPTLAVLPSVDALDELAHACLARVGVARAGASSSPCVDAQSRQECNRAEIS